jgi:predicted amidohydrolase
MIVALASPRPAASLDDGLDKVRRLTAEAAARGAAVVCFPEAYLPGLRGQDFDVPPFDEPTRERVVRATADWARAYRVAVILGTERLVPAGRQIASYVLAADGRVLGCQTKNQIDPTEDRYYVPGDTRQVFEVGGLKFGVSICHEGWRYPETVRWAAVRGAKVVFHPQHTGSEFGAPVQTAWGAAGGPYYEQAMAMRARENTVYFASANYALRFPESATSLVAPDGTCQAHLPYGAEGVLVEPIDVGRATGLLAARYAPDRYREADAE